MSSLPNTIGVIGANGRIGELVLRLAKQQGWDALAVDRERDEVGLDWPGASLPLLVCTRNDALPEVVKRVHPSRRADLVFVQNGMVQPWLAENDLAGCTQGVLYVAVTHVGAEPVGGGTSVFNGRWSGPIAKLLRAGGIPARAVRATAYKREVSVKLAWICIHGLLGQALGVTVGEIAQEHGDRVHALCRELQPLLAKEPGLDLSADDLARRLMAYSASIPHFPSSLKEWRWRNGWLIDAAQRHGVPLPHHTRWLERAGGPPA